MSLQSTRFKRYLHEMVTLISRCTLFAALYMPTTYYSTLSSTHEEFSREVVLIVVWLMVLI
jgi:hypothetical protein